MDTIGGNHILNNLADGNLTYLQELFESSDLDNQLIIHRIVETLIHISNSEDIRWKAICLFSRITKLDRAAEVYPFQSLNQK